MRRTDEKKPEPCSRPIPAAELAGLEAAAKAEAHRRLLISTCRRWLVWPFLTTAIILALIWAAIWLLPFESVNRAPNWGPLATLAAALIAGAISLNALIITPSRLRKIELSLHYVERQISDFWGPLYGELRSGEYYYQELLQNIKKDDSRVLNDGGVMMRIAPFSHDPFASYRPAHLGGGKEWKAWCEYIEEYALPHNAAIAHIIKSRYELVGQDYIPDIQMFLAHEAELRTKFLAFKDESPIKWQSHPPRLEHPFPEAFEYHVHQKVRFLFYLQKRYRLEIEGASILRQREVVLKAAVRRVRSREAPPCECCAVVDHGNPSRRAHHGRA